MVYSAPRMEEVSTFQGSFKRSTRVLYRIRALGSGDP